MFNRVTLSVALLASAGFASALVIPRTIDLESDGTGTVITTKATIPILGTKITGGWLFSPPPSDLAGGKPGTLFLDSGATIIDEIIWTKSNITFLTADFTAPAKNTLTIAKTGDDTVYVPIGPGGAVQPGSISTTNLTYHFTDNETPGPEAALVLVGMGAQLLRRKRNRV